MLRPARRSVGNHRQPVPYRLNKCPLGQSPEERPGTNKSAKPGVLPWRPSHVRHIFFARVAEPGPLITSGSGGASAVPVPSSSLPSPDSTSRPLDEADRTGIMESLLMTVSFSTLIYSGEDVSSILAQRAGPHLLSLIAVTLHLVVLARATLLVVWHQLSPSWSAPRAIDRLRSAPSFRYQAEMVPHA
jgi:hypothetical protein